MLWRWHHMKHKSFNGCFDDDITWKSSIQKQELGKARERGQSFVLYIPSVVAFLQMFPTLPPPSSVSLSLCTDSEDNNMVSGRKNDCTCSVIPIGFFGGSGYETSVRCIMTLPSQKSSDPNTSKIFVLQVATVLNFRNTVHVALIDDFQVWGL